jgi:tetratricopeptide (TPR) repeat protein
MWLSRGLLIFIIPLIALSCAPKAKIPPKPPISEKVPTPGEGEKPKEEPRDAILFNLGEHLFSQEDFADAGLKFRDLIEQYPSSPLVNEAKYKLGICYAKTGRYEDSLRLLREVLPLSLSPLRKATIHSIMAENYGGLGDYFEALRWYNKAMEDAEEAAPGGPIHV